MKLPGTKYDAVTNKVGLTVRSSSRACPLACCHCTPTACDADVFARPLQSPVDIKFHSLIATLTV